MQPLPLRLLKKLKESGCPQALIPYSHRWLRQATRTDRGMEGHATPWEAASGRAQYAVPEEDAVRCSMPRGSVLLFSGGVLHSAGKNNASTGRRTVLSGYQLGWLRPENNFWGDKALRDAVYNGGPAPFDKTMLELLGHWDPDTALEQEKSGVYKQVRYLGRTKEQVLADAGHTHQGGSSGYEEFG